MVRLVQASLQRLIEPVVTLLGYELVGIDMLSQGRHSVLRIYIDKDGGINVDDCARVSHQVSGLFDVEEPIQGQYSLEVSSPGLDRPLFTVEQFIKFSGNVVSLRLNKPLAGRRNYKGVLQGVREDQVMLDVDGEKICLALNNIEKAHLVPEK